MRTIVGFAIVAAALIVVVIVGWNASTRVDAGVDAAVMGPRIDPIALTTSAGLPVEQFEDYTEVFDSHR